MGRRDSSDWHAPVIFVSTCMLATCGTDVVFDLMYENIVHVLLVSIVVMCGTDVVFH